MKAIRILFLAGIILMNSSISWAQQSNVSLNREVEVLNLDWLKKVKIYYPEIARNLEIDGLNRFEILVDSTGKYITHRPLDPPLPILTPKIKSVLHLLEFKPAQKNGQNVEAWIEVYFRFRIESGYWYSSSNHHNGLAKMQEQNYQAALEYFDQAVQMDYVMNINIQMQRAVALCMIGDTTASIQAFQRILSKRLAFDKVWDSIVENLHGKSVYYTEERKLFFGLEEEAFALLKDIKNAQIQMLIEEVRKAYFIEIID